MNDNSAVTQEQMQEMIEQAMSDPRMQRAMRANQERAWKRRGTPIPDPKQRAKNPKTQKLPKLRHPKRKVARGVKPVVPMGIKITQAFLEREAAK